MLARPSVATAMSQIGSEVIRCCVAASSLGQSISAGLYGSCVVSIVRHISDLCASLPGRIAPAGFAGISRGKAVKAAFAIGAFMLGSGSPSSQCSKRSEANIGCGDLLGDQRIQ